MRIIIRFHVVAVGIFIFYVSAKFQTKKQPTIVIILHCLSSPGEILIPQNKVQTAL